MGFELNELMHGLLVGDRELIVEECWGDNQQVAPCDRARSTCTEQAWQSET